MFIPINPSSIRLFIIWFVDITCKWFARHLFLDNLIEMVHVVLDIAVDSPVSLIRNDEII